MDNKYEHLSERDKELAEYMTKIRMEKERKYPMDRLSRFVYRLVSLAISALVLLGCFYGIAFLLRLLFGVLGII